MDPSQRFQVSVLLSFSSAPEEQLPTVESLGEPRWRGGLDAAQPQQAVEEVFGKPLLVSLRCEIAHQASHLSPGDRLRQGNKKIRRTQVGVVLGNFIFQNEVLPECVPGEVADQTVVLMKSELEKIREQVQNVE